jgi:uncharacterized membrane protein YfcA
MSIHTFLIIAVVFLAVFTQSVSGFGVALVSMALLSQLAGLRVATPLVALIALSLELLLLFHYRRAVELKAVWRVAIASVVGIPLGVIAFEQVAEKFALAVLGVVIAGYALYTLFRLKLPRLAHPGWAYGFGLAAGMLGGAYNTSGPPVIIYGDCRRWLPIEFKGNLQGFFVVNSVFVVVSHALARNLTPPVWQLYLLALPAVGLGLVAGLSLDRYLNPQRFRQLVLWLLVLLGLRLIF